MRTKKPKRRVNIWLDDQRPAPSQYIHCKTVREARSLLCDKKYTIVNKMSLDYHLDQEESGCDLVRWMIATNTWPKCMPNVHSGDFRGRYEMQELIERHFPNSPKQRKK